MGPDPSSLRVLVLHNNDFAHLDRDRGDFASRADVENAARGIAAALRARGHRAELLGVDGDSLAELLAGLRAAPPDLVFNLCESLCGDSRNEVVVPSLLELSGVPYTGSGPLALGLALRKDRAKELLHARGVPTPESVTLESPEVRGPLPQFPVIVKPTREDASVGISAGSVVRDRAALAAAVARVLDELSQPALVERFIEGRELYVSLLGNEPPRALPFHEIDFSSLPPELPRIVSYSGKWDTASVEFAGTRPTRCLLDEPTRLRVEEAARAAFAALELRDYGRVDVRLAADGTPYVIDVNPNCDLTEGAGFSRAAAYGGFDYPGLVEQVCRIALERHAHERRYALDAVAENPAAPAATDAPDGDRLVAIDVGQHAAALAAGPPRARGADRERRAVHGGGGAVRARADRRRAR